MANKPYLKELVDINTKNVILASASPRRKELLSNIGLNFSIMPSLADENILNYTSFENYVISAARMKGCEVSQKIENGIVIACDTIVVVEKEIKLKPQSEKEAFLMLKQLSGKWHKVYTSLFIYDKYQDWIVTDVSMTDVKFANLKTSQIERYIATKEPMDKAGAYGIQGYASSFIERIEGCYFSVMGFPISLFTRKINELGYFI